MIRFISRMVCAAALVCAASTAAFGQFNGIKVNPYVFNNYQPSNLTITNSNSIPGSVTIDDRDMFNATGTGANRHDALLSQDNGATAYNFSIDTPLTFSATLVLTDGSDSPRKEAGIRLNSTVTGDCLLIVNSDAGEIVAFGGPFYSFRAAPFNEPAYVPGQSITLGMKYTPGSPSTTNATPATLEYFIDRGSGVDPSGPLPFTNLEGGAVNFQAGVYAQGGSGSTVANSDFFNAAFTNITASVPEPASLGAISLAGMALLARRRSA